MRPHPPSTFTYCVAERPADDSVGTGVHYLGEHATARRARADHHAAAAAPPAPLPMRDVLLTPGEIQRLAPAATGQHPAIVAVARVVHRQPSGLGVDVSRCSGQHI